MVAAVLAVAIKQAHYKALLVLQTLAAAVAGHKTLQAMLVVQG
jgi:hypothetical protein